jgi:50S ribosomal protein L16 3-hydroxylase
LKQQFPQALAVGEFLKRHWQKRSYAETAVAGDELPGLDPDEIAWLATQPDVESRLVLTERDGDSSRYRVETGPFDPERLSALPEADWTLLVQDVEKHLPDFRRYFDLVPYIPDWRVDDLMVSVAAPGGSVGPHRDNYDVFLVQGAGHREWLFADRETVRDDESSDALSLLEPFEADNARLVSAGDVIYLPPGEPHWGIARTLCTTWSIGMRAPTSLELSLGAERLLDIPQPDTGEIRFYADPDLGDDESEPGMISPAAVERLRTQSLLEPGLTQTELAMVLGAVVTDPKAWLMPEPADRLDATSVVHGMARIAWYASGDDRLVFVNGVVQAVSQASLDAFRDCCKSRLAGPPLLDLAGDDDGAGFLEWLRLNGMFDAAPGAK